MERKLIIGGIYRHFKGKIYQVKFLAKDSSTTEDVVVYQAMYPPYSYWTRPLREFAERVDRAKYPQVRQEYRFELMEVSDMSSVTDVKTSVDFETPQMETARVSQEKGAVDDRTFIRALTSGRPADYLTGKMSEEEIASRGLMQILDAQTFREKRQLLTGLRPYLNRIMIENIAVALDIVLEEESEEEQIDSILRCLQTQEHYEGGRLR